MLPGRRRRWRLAFLLALAGLSLVQTAWILVVPPFRGLDEHDHAFRASSVALGHWLPDYERVEVGRGELIPVEADVVAAAEPVCESFSYTDRDDCHPVSSLGGGVVTVGSAAARYHPAYYWAVGTAARPWEGAASLYAMRAATALVTALLVAGAWLVLAGWGRTRWPLVAGLLALTPVVTYSTSVAAPNGLELTGAFLLWSSLLGLARGTLSERAGNAALAVATLGAVVVGTVRSLGPLWLGLIVVSWAALVGPAKLRRLYAARRGPWVAAVIVSVASAVGGAAWTLVADTNNPTHESPASFGSPWPDVLLQPLVWLAQVVAAFPARNELAPASVYAAVLVLCWVLVALGWLGSPRRGRLLLVAMLMASVAVPLVLTLVSFAQIGFAWQGRYGWPYSMGVLLVLGWLLDRSRLRIPGGLGTAVLALVAGTVAVSTLLGQLHVLAVESEESPLSGDPSWLQAPPPLVAVLTITGFAALTVAGVLLRRNDPVDPSVSVDSTAAAAGDSLAR